MSKTGKSRESREALSLICRVQDFLWKSITRWFESWVPVLHSPHLPCKLWISLSCSGLCIASTNVLSLLPLLQPYCCSVTLIWIIRCIHSQTICTCFLGEQNTTKMFYNPHKTESFYFPHDYVLKSFSVSSVSTALLPLSKIFKLSAPKICNGSNGRHQDVIPLRWLKCSHVIV